MIGGENVTATNEEKILQLLEVMQADISGMKADIAQLKASQEELKATQEEMKETLSEHTVVLNAILEWADECREADRFPLPKIM
jgi:cell division protein FtsB